MHDADRLAEWIERAAVNRGLARRARIVLMLSEGDSPGVTAEAVGCSRQTVVKWRDRYRCEGLAGLQDAPRRRRPPKVATKTVLQRTLEPAGSGHQRWSTRLLGSELGISNVAVATVWRRWGIAASSVTDGIQLITVPALAGMVCSVSGAYVDGGLSLLAVDMVDRSSSVVARPVAARPDIGDQLERMGGLPQAERLARSQARFARLGVAGRVESGDDARR